MLELLARDRAVAEQSGAACVILLGLPQFDLAIANFSPQSIGICKKRANSPYGAGEVGLGVAHGHLRIRGVQFQERLIPSDGLRVISVQSDDRARDLRRDLHDIAVHVAIIGALEVARVPVPVASVTQGANDNHRGKDFEFATPGAHNWRATRRRVAGRRFGCR
jgi:hypothetical protein